MTENGSFFVGDDSDKALVESRHNNTTIPRIITLSGNWGFPEASNFLRDGPDHGCSGAYRSKRAEFKKMGTKDNKRQQKTTTRSLDFFEGLT